MKDILMTQTALSCFLYKKSKFRLTLTHLSLRCRMYDLVQKKTNAVAHEGS
jgi:hypothetical protein